jgi:aryl-alcohol dehydrogenase-like predicted oxidoreductase
VAQPSRIGFGTMRLTGAGALGPPANLAEAHRVLRSALELGVRVFDTAWYYGPDVANQLLAEATRRWPEGLTIATKLGWAWDRHGGLVSAHTPEGLGAGMERDLGVLGGVRSRSPICVGTTIDRSVTPSASQWPR